MVPVMLGLYVTRRRVAGEPGAVTTALCVGAPVLLLLAPWFVKFHAVYGSFLPTWIPSDREMIEGNPFIQMVTQRPFYYFFLQLFLLCPFLCLPLWGIPAALQQRDRDQGLAWLWLLWLLLAFTLLATLAGFSFQMRYVAMAVLPAYVLLGLALERLGFPRRPAPLAITLAAFALNAATAAFYATNDVWADLFTLLQLPDGPP